MTCDVGCLLRDQGIKAVSQDAATANESDTLHFLYAS
jgi:hypothetical protein